jgi:hypothetical protein
MDAWAILMIAGCFAVLILAAVVVHNRRSSVPQLAQEDDSDEAGDSGGMPSILMPFSGATVCPKCLTFVKTKDYCPGGPACSLRARGEHLHRRCACGYEWAEETADAMQFGTPVPGSIGSPEREAEQRKRNDLAKMRAEAMRPVPGGGY